LLENNLFTDCRNYCWAFGIGVANLVARHNTVLRGGTAFGSGSPSIQWATNTDADNASGKLADGNIIDRPSIDDSVTQTGNVWIYASGSGSNIRVPGLSFDGSMNPVNLPGNHAGAGYRRPSGVPW
jgi:hypothetical protein